MYLPKSIFALLLLLAILPATAHAEEASTKTVFPHVTIDREKKEMRIDATFSGELGTSKAILEFLLICSKEKSYEAAFSTEADANHVHLGLMLLGLKPGLPDFVQKKGETEAERAARNLPAPVDMLLEWDENGVTKSARIERFLTFRATDKKLDPMPWAFTGSYMYTTDEGKKILAASYSNVIAALLFNPAAIINCPYYEPSPYNAPDVGFSIDIPSLPPYFTEKGEVEQDGKMVSFVAARECPVTFVLRPSAMKLPERPVPLPTDDDESKTTAQTTTPEKTENATPKDVTAVPTVESAPSEKTSDTHGKDMLLVYVLIGLGVLALANYVRISLKPKNQA